MDVGGRGGARWRAQTWAQKKSATVAILSGLMFGLVWSDSAPAMAAPVWHVTGIDGSAQSVALPGEGRVRPGMDLSPSASGWVWVESGSTLLLEIPGRDHPMALAQFEEFSHLSALPEGLALWAGRMKLTVDAPLETPIVTSHGRIAPNSGAILLIEADGRGLEVTSVKSGALFTAAGHETAVIVPEGRSLSLSHSRPPKLADASPAAMRKGFEPFLGMRFKHAGPAIDLDVYSPRPGGWASGPAVTVNGRIAGSGPGVTVTVDGRPAALDGEGRFSAQARLGPGQGRWIDVRASAADGRESVWSTRVQSDAEPPQITLLTPPDAETPDRETVIRGEVSEPALVFINAEPVPTRNRRFESAARLSPGDNTIRIMAVDPAGNRGLQEVSVRRITAALDARIREIRREAGRIYLLLGTAPSATVLAQGRQWAADAKGSVLLDLEDRPGSGEAIEIDVRSAGGGQARLRLPVGAGADWQPPQITEVEMDPQVVEVLSGFKIMAKVSDAGTLRPHAPGRILDSEGASVQEFRLSAADGGYAAAVALGRDIQAGSYTVEIGPVSDANGFTSAAAAQKRLVVENRPPAPVKGLIITPTDDGVLITFERNREDDIDRYRIERSSTRQGGYLLVAETDEPIYTDRWRPQPGVGYYYRVLAYDLSGQAGEPSEAAELSASWSPGGAVAGVAGLRVERTQNVWRLYWETQKAAAGYNIYVIEAGGPRRLGSVRQPPYVLERPSPGRYAVSAVGGRPPVESEMSELSVNP